MQGSKFIFGLRSSCASGRTGKIFRRTVDFMWGIFFAMVHMQCTELYYLLLVSVWRCIRLNHIYGDMDMPKIWANFLFVSFVGQEQKVWITIHKLNFLTLRVRVVYEEVSYGGGYSYGFFNSKIYFFSCWVGRKLINKLSLFSNFE